MEYLLVENMDMSFLKLFTEYIASKETQYLLYCTRLSLC